MTKPYSDEDLANQLISDRTWRIREISDLNAAVLRADQVARGVLLRAAVAICYAHWEGYVKFAAKKYLEHIALRKIQYHDLDRQFLRNHFLPRLNALSTSRKSITERCALIDEIFNSVSLKFARVNEDLISTHSNLSFDIFRDICFVCGVSFSAFEGEQTFIDTILLKRRNAIAHGEDTFVGLEDVKLVAECTIKLIRMFGDALENQAVLKAYKK